MSDQYAVSFAHRTEYPIILMCRVLAVSRAGDYAAQGRAPSTRATADLALAVTISDSFTTGRRRSGAPRVHQALRVATDSAHTVPLADHVVARQFAVGGAVNTVWVSDTTFIPTGEGWRYLAVVIDLASRFVVGWATSARNDTTLVLAALQRATVIRRPGRGAVHHADRGSTYASHDYRAARTRQGMLASMSRKGDCWDSRGTVLHHAGMGAARGQRLHHPRDGVARASAVHGTRVRLGAAASYPWVRVTQRFRA